jgi:TorA maturation chaperone TorD
MNTEWTEEQLQGAALVGQTLGPLYLEEPLSEAAEPLFAQLRELDVAEAAAEWPFVEAAEAARYLQLICGDIQDAATMDDLKWEFRRLFKGPAAMPAPPWGSVYTDRDCVIFGMSCLALRAWMRENGVKRNQDERDPDDHIGLMLLMLAWLCAEKPELLDEFLAQHFLTWAGHFLDELAAAAHRDFYRGLALLTKASLDGLQQVRGLEVKTPHFYR